MSVSVRIALYKHPKYMFHMIREFSENPTSSEMVRFSEWVEIEFVERPVEEIVPDQLAALDKEIEKATSEFAKTLNGLKQQKADLQALTQEVP